MTGAATIVVGYAVLYPRHEGMSVAKRAAETNIGKKSIGQVHACMTT